MLPAFEATAMVRTRSPAIGFGAFHHQGLPSGQPLGRGRQPDWVHLERDHLRVTGESSDGNTFNLSLVRSKTVVRSADRGWLGTTFWLTDGAKYVGLRVKRKAAAQTEQALSTYLGTKDVGVT